MASIPEQAAMPTKVRRNGFRDLVAAVESLMSCLRYGTLGYFFRKICSVCGKPQQLLDINGRTRVSRIHAFLPRLRRLGGAFVAINKR